MSESAPERMRALLLQRYDADADAAIRGLAVADRPTPRPRRGQVLVRIEAAPCNPSDLLFVQGLYGVRKTLPTVPGWEGAGRVVASGGGWLARRLVGKRVACGGQSDADGTWAEFYVADAASCVPLRRGLGIEQGATLLINPLTAVGLMEMARRRGTRALVQTAAASQLGRMIATLARRRAIPLVNVVRRAEQVELLRGAGGVHVLDSSRETFDDELRRTCRELRADLAFDAVAGEMTGRLLGAMPAGGRVVVYGALSESHCAAIDPIGVVFHDKSVEGFFLGTWLRGRGLPGTLLDTARVQRLVGQGAFETRIRRSVGLEDAVEALLAYRGEMTAGKVLIRPGPAAIVR